MYASSQVQLRCTTPGHEPVTSPCQIVSASAAYLVVVHTLGSLGQAKVPNFQVFYPNGQPLRKNFKWTLEEVGVVQHDNGDEA